MNFKVWLFFEYGLWFDGIILYMQFLTKRIYFHEKIFPVVTLAFCPVKNFIATAQT